MRERDSLLGNKALQCPASTAEKGRCTIVVENGRLPILLQIGHTLPEPRYLLAELTEFKSGGLFVHAYPALRDLRARCLHVELQYTRRRPDFFGGGSGRPQALQNSIPLLAGMPSGAAALPSDALHFVTRGGGMSGDFEARFVTAPSSRLKPVCDTSRVTVPGRRWNS